MNSTFLTRYNFEHKLIPSVFFLAQEYFLSDLLEDHCETIRKLLEDTLEPDEKLPFEIKDIKVVQKTFVKNMNQSLIVRIGMPEPDCDLLCRYCYLCLQNKPKHIAYFTSEKSAGASYMLCGWRDINTHLNYGVAPLNPNKEFDMVSDIFIKLCVK